MKPLKGLVIAIGVFCLLFPFFSPLPAMGQSGIKIGTLSISSVPGTRKNLLIKSSVEVKAVFTDTGGNTEYYIGEMGIKLGVDLSLQSDQDMGYLVFSPSSAYKTGSYALAGKYFGSKASAAVGGGPAVQILIGGFDKSFSLQPLSLGGVQGVGAAAGMGYLYLQKDPAR